MPRLQFNLNGIVLRHLFVYLPLRWMAFISASSPRYLSSTSLSCSQRHFNFLPQRYSSTMEVSMHEPTVSTRVFKRASLDFKRRNLSR